MTFSKNKLALAVMAASISLTSTQGAADETKQQASDSSPTLLKETKVAAARSNQTLEAVAASISVICDAELEADMAQDLNDVFEYTPGVSINNAGRQGAQNINIRGIEGKRIKIHR